MKKFKDIAGAVHAIDAGFMHLLPAGCVEISDAEADAILNPPKTQAQLDAEASAAAKAELLRIDMASIRSMREWIAAQPTAPQILKDKEAAAVIERSKVQV